MSQENLETIHRGYDAMRRRDLHALLDVSHPEFEGTFRILEVDGGVYRGHEGGRLSQASVDSPVYAVWTVLGDGKITRMRGYVDRDEALEAAGLSE